MTVTTATALDCLLAEIRGCRHCVVSPEGEPLPHQPRPVIVASTTARLAIAGQAPGTRVHASGVPFADPSGDRLRHWLGVTPEEFHDAARIAIVPMGFCFPGLDAKGGDLAPRRECAPLWRTRVMAELPQVELLLLVGQYAQAWHLGKERGRTLSQTVAGWRQQLAVERKPRLLPLPHPSWRNTGWLKKNRYFDQELVPELRQLVRALITR